MLFLVGMRLKAVSGAKKFFFDKPYVLGRVAEMKRRGLSQIGAFIRRRGRSLLRRRKKTSEPGQPPSVHSDNENASLKKILFAYEPDSGNVVVGPVILNMVTQAKVGGSANFIWNGTVPELHEHGGVATIREFQYRSKREFPSGDANGPWFRIDARFSREWYAKRPQRLRRAKYPKRSFMQPAFDEALTNDKLAPAWRYALRP